MESRAFTESSFADLLKHLRAGDNRAVSKLWEHYFKRMLFVARKKLAGAQRKARDEEDIALSAFKSFCLGFQQGRFDRAGDDCDLWPLLVTLTVNKAIDHLRHENRKKRAHANAPPAAMEDLLSSEFAPDLQLIADESFAKLLAALDETGDSSLRSLALLKLENQPPADIASELGCTIRTLQRKLKTIRAIWQVIET